MYYLMSNPKSLSTLLIREKLCVFSPAIVWSSFLSGWLKYSSEAWVLCRYLVSYLGTLVFVLVKRVKVAAKKLRHERQNSR